jgi:hypothetical protein
MLISRRATVRLDGEGGVDQCSVMATSHKLLGRRHGGHAQDGSGHVAQRTAVVGQRQVIVARFGRILLKRVEVILLTLEVILLVVAQRLAISTRLVCATMSKNVIRSMKLVGGYLV